MQNIIDYWKNVFKNLLWIKSANSHEKLMIVMLFTFYEEAETVETGKSKRMVKDTDKFNKPQTKINCREPTQI